MGGIVNLVETYWLYLVPISIGLTLVWTLVWFLRERRVSDQLVRWKMMIDREEMLRENEHWGQGNDDETPSPLKTPSPITQLLQRDDVSLRVLEEVHELPRNTRRRDYWGSPDSPRLRLLVSIRNELRGHLRSSVQESDFPKIRDRVLGLLDQIKKELDQIKKEKDDLRHKEPFNDIRDPEKSLLIDIFEEIDPSHTIVKQKAFQLANIIKLKYQDVQNLQAENAKAAIWTKWGAAGTVVFGVLSLILSMLTIMT